MFATLAATLLIVQQPPAAVAVKAADPTSLVYTGVMKLDVEGQEGQVKFTATRKENKKDAVKEVTITWTDGTMSFGGQEQDMPPLDPFTFKTKPDGTIGDCSGGIPGHSSTQFVLLMHVLTTKEPLATGKSVGLKLDKAGDAPAIAITLKRLDDEKVGEETLQLFEQTAKSEGDDSLDTVGKFWVKADGTIVKIEQAIKSLQVGDGGQAGKGTFTLTLKK